MEDPVDCSVSLHWQANIMFRELELGMAQEMFDVLFVPGNEVINRDYVVPFLDEPVTNV